MDEEELARQVDGAFGEDPVGDALKALGFEESRSNSVAYMRVADEDEPIRLIQLDD
jgi:hypothetical protein